MSSGMSSRMCSAVRHASSAVVKWTQIFDVATLLRHPRNSETTGQTIFVENCLDEDMHPIQRRQFSLHFARVSFHLGTKWKETRAK